MRLNCIDSFDLRYTVVRVKVTYWVKVQADQAFIFQSDSGASTAAPQSTVGATNPPITSPLPNIVSSYLYVSTVRVKKLMFFKFFSAITRFFFISTK